MTKHPIEVITSVERRRRWQGRQEAVRPHRSWTDGIIFDPAIPAFLLIRPRSVARFFAASASRYLPANNRAVQA